MGWTRFAIAFDLHGSEQHAPTVRAFHRFCDDFKPQRRLIGGDVWDFPRLRDGAAGRDLRVPLTPDFEKGCEFIDRFAPDTVLLGNHDIRLWEAAADKCHPDNEIAARLLKDFRQRQARQKFAVLPYDKARVVRVGPLNVLHGVYAGESACRKHAQVYGPAIYGHVHTSEHASVPHHGRRLEAWSAPCMVRLDLPYTKRLPATLKWVNGWMFGAVNGRKYHVETARVENGSAMYATGLKAVAA